MKNLVFILCGMIWMGNLPTRANQPRPLAKLGDRILSSSLGTWCSPKNRCPGSPRGGIRYEPRVREEPPLELLLSLGVCSMAIWLGIPVRRDRHTWTSCYDMLDKEVQ